jgi:hypothetical protein
MREKNLLFNPGVGTAGTIALATFLGLILWSVHSVFVVDNVDVYAENGLIETIQTILLGIACIVFLASVMLEKRSDKLILLFCSLLCYSFVLRELDVQSFDIPAALKFFGYGAGRNTTLAAAFLATFIYAAFHFSYYKSAALNFLRSTHGMLMIIAGGVLFISDFFERYGSMVHHVYVEEIFELCGYVFILLAAFAAKASSHRMTARSGKLSDTGD